MLRRRERGVPVLLGGFAQTISHRRARHTGRNDAAGRRRPARPERRGDSRNLDTHQSGELLQHAGQENPLAGTQQLRPGDRRLLPLARDHHPAETQGADSRKAKDGLRRHPRPEGH